MNILLLCNKPPYPAAEGGPMAMNSIIMGLLDAGHKVKVLAVNSPKFNVSPDSIPAEYKAKTGIELIDVDLEVHPIKAFLNLFTDKSYHVERFISKEFDKRLVEVLHAEKFDVVQLEMLYMTPYIDTIRKNSNAIVVLRAHNVEHLIWERIANATSFLPKKLYVRHLARTLKKYELSAVNKVDGVAAITRKDAAFFRRTCSRPVVDIPFGVYPEQFEPKYEIEGKPRFYHIGSMNWTPNEEGIKWFVDNVLQDLLAKVPDFVFHLAGRNMPQWMKETNDPHLDVVGEVADAHQFVNSNNVAIVPLLSGSGIRIKIIESMALGKTVITTRIGAEGILYDEDTNIIIAETKAKMVEAIRRIDAEPQMAEQIGRAARKLVEDRYDNKKIISRLMLFYEQLKPSSKMTFA